MTAFTRRQLALRSRALARSCSLDGARARERAALSRVHGLYKFDFHEETRCFVARNLGCAVGTGRKRRAVLGWILFSYRRRLVVLLCPRFLLARARTDTCKFDARAFYRTAQGFFLNNYT